MRAFGGTSAIKHPVLSPRRNPPSYPCTKEDELTMTEHTEQTPSVLEDPLLNRGAAFTLAERETLGLTGRLPAAVLTLEEQARRVYRAAGAAARATWPRTSTWSSCTTATRCCTTRCWPTTWPSCCRSSTTPRSATRSSSTPTSTGARGASTCPSTGPTTSRRRSPRLELGPDDVDLIVCTDAEEILGIGDWGVGGIQISVGKLAVYTAAAGIDPRRVIPVSLDVGTDNEGLLNDPLYLGNRHARVRGDAYDAFIEKYLQTASVAVPERAAALRGLRRGQRPADPGQLPGQYRIFNDDMQGTGAMVMAGLFNALKVTGTRWRDQRVVVFGGGTAGVGIADQIRDADGPRRAGRAGHAAGLDRGPARPAHRRHGRRPAGLPASVRPPGRRGRRLGQDAGRGRPVRRHRWPEMAALRRPGPPRASSPWRPWSSRSSPRS